ncbi:MAG: S8 family peptidase [Eubacteriales bacterium]|nr:S8 family peptidase [Eubacteriales bacterium]
MDRVRKAVHAQEAYQKGFFGQGVTVAVLDTGLFLHPDFTGRVAGFQDILRKRGMCYDDSSHGTHVGGILAGDGRMSAGKYAGIAPACRILPVKVLDRKGNGMRSDVEKGIAWVIQKKEEYGIRIMNISVGTVKEDQELDRTILDAVERAWDSGIVVVVAGGNMGPEPMSITVPGNSRKVITVGASDDCRLPAGRRDVRPCYSGRGPTHECICKPDICAPGSGIMACAPKLVGKGFFYQVKSGTSMATPVVSGAIALLLSRYPNLTNVEVKMRLRETAEDLGMPRNQQGWGQIHVGRLLA